MTRNINDDSRPGEPQNKTSPNPHLVEIHYEAAESSSFRYLPFEKSDSCIELDIKVFPKTNEAERRDSV